MINTLICSFVYSGLFAFLSVGSYVFVEFLGVDESLFGFYFVFIVVGYISGSYVSARLSSRFSEIRLMGLGSVSAFASGSTMLVF